MSSLKHLRNNPRYLRTQAKIERLVHQSLPFSEVAERAFEATKAAVREMWDTTSFFEDLGVRYNGPFDGHDIEELERAFRNAAQFDGPTVIHVMTEKGRGYAPAENDPVKRLHDMGHPKAGSYTAAFTEALIKEADARPELVAITAAMPDSTGLLPFSERFPDRCIDVGIAEQHAVTAAAGMSMGGLRPVFVVYATFLSRAFDQVNLDVGLHHEPVVFCLDRAGITGDDGASHHGVLDMMLLSKVPGMTVLAPSSYQELQQMLHDALEITSGPVAIRYPKTAAPSADESEVGHGLKARKISAGEDVCILAVGKMVAAARQAAERLDADGVSCTVWDVRSVKPLDPDMLENAGTHPLVVTIEDGVREGGCGSAIRDQLADQPGNPAVKVLGVPLEYIPHGNVDQILATLGLDADGIVHTVSGG